jgi:hypothetical protein
MIQRRLPRMDTEEPMTGELRAPRGGAVPELAAAQPQPAAPGAAATPPSQQPVTPAQGPQRGGGEASAATAPVELPKPVLEERPREIPWAVSRPEGAQGRMLFLGWLDPERHFELWRDEAGREFVRHIGGQWYGRAELESAWRRLVDEVLSRSNVVEVVPPYGTRRVLVKEGGRWFEVRYDPERNVYEKVPADVGWVVWQLLYTAAGLSPYAVRATTVSDPGALVRDFPSALVFWGVDDALRLARLKKLLGVSSPSAFVWDAIAERLRREGVPVSFPDRETYDRFMALVEDVARHPERYTWEKIREEAKRIFSATKVASKP